MSPDVTVNVDVKGTEKVTEGFRKMGEDAAKIRTKMKPSLTQSETCCIGAWRVSVIS